MENTTSDTEQLGPNATLKIQKESINNIHDKTTYRAIVHRTKEIRLLSCEKEHIYMMTALAIGLTWVKGNTTSSWKNPILLSINIRKTLIGLILMHLLAMVT